MSNQRIIATLSIVSFAVTLVVQVSLAEVWLHITRKNGVLRVGAAIAA